MATFDLSNLRLADGAPAALGDLAVFVERIHREHAVSFVAAGDERIFAYGGNGYTVIFGERLFAGLVELTTPTGTIRIEPVSSGAIDAHWAEANNATSITEQVADAIHQLDLYYRRRYWRP